MVKQMNSKKFKKESEKCISSMGYEFMEWVIVTHRDYWAFGFVRKEGKCYGCISVFDFGSGIIIEILQQKDYKKFIL